MEQLELQMSDGVYVYATVRLPAEKPKGHVHLLHGMAEHSGRYDKVAEALVDAGYMVTAHDHRGHGKTVDMNGKRGHFGDEGGFPRVVEDVYEVVTYMRAQYPTNKFVLFGHSMGSFIARRFIQLHGHLVDKVVLSGTGDDSGVARYGGIALGYIMGKRQGFDRKNLLLDELVFGRFNKGIQKPLTKFDWLSKNPTHVFSYMMDEYCGFVPTTQFFLDLFDGLGLVHDLREVARIPKDLPILLFSGDEDPVGNFSKGVWKVAKQYDRAGLKHVTVRFYEGGRHELLNDTTRPVVLQQVIEWIEA